MQIVSYADWTSILRAKLDMDIDYAILVRMVPDVRLVDFYARVEESAGRGLSRILSTDKITKTIAALAGMERLKGRWIAGLVKK